MKTILVLALATFCVSVTGQQTPPASDIQAIFEHTKTATVIILAGEGAGRLNSVATGVIVSKDGVIFTALHAIKGAAEVQVRLATGDVFDRVPLLGSDERRDVAAIKIAAGALSALTPRSAPPPLFFGAPSPPSSEPHPKNTHPKSH